MTSTQYLLRDAAAKLCRASAWLDPRRGDANHVMEQALTLISDTRLMLESIEMSLALNKAMREKEIQAGQLQGNQK